MEARADALRRFTPEQLERLDVLLERTPAGGLLPAEAYPPDSLRVFRLALREHGITWELPVAAHIRGPGGVGGIVGGVSTHPQNLTEFERAELSAIADFASLALRKACALRPSAMQVCGAPPMIRPAEP